MVSTGTGDAQETGLVGLNASCCVQSQHQRFVLILHLFSQLHLFCATISIPTYYIINAHWIQPLTRGYGREREINAM